MHVSEHGPPGQVLFSLDSENRCKVIFLTLFELKIHEI